MFTHLEAIINLCLNITTKASQEFYRTIGALTKYSSREAFPLNSFATLAREGDASNTISQKLIAQVDGSVYPFEDG